MKVFNPTGWTIETKSAGQPYIFPPFSEVEVYDIYHVEQMCISNKHLGLVHLEYGPKKQEKYPNFEDYKREQEISGLKEVLKFKERCLNDEKQAQKEAKAHGSTGDVENINVEKFEKEIALIKKWLKAAGATEKAKEEEVVPERPEWKVKNEPRPNEGKSQNIAR